MKSSNAQILKDLQQYRQMAAKITPQREAEVMKILQPHVDRLTEIVLNEQNLFREETNNQAQYVQKLKLNTTTLKEIEKRYKSNSEALTNNFESQIRAKRIRESKNPLGQEALAGKSLEQLVTEEENLLQEKTKIGEEVSQFGVTPEKDGNILNSIKSIQKKMKKDLDEQEKKLDDLQHKKDIFSKELNIHISLPVFSESGARNALGDYDLLKHLSSEDRKTVIVFLDDIVPLTIGAIEYKNLVNHGQYSHLFRALCAGIPHPMLLCNGEYSISMKGYQHLAEGFGPSVVADEHLKMMIYENFNDKTHISHQLFTEYSAVANTFYIQWEADSKQVFPQTAEDRSDLRHPPFWIINTELLDTLEQILTQEPEISFPDLAIRLNESFPNPHEQKKRQENLLELKRLHEETPEQVLITEQRYYMQKQMEQMEENARLQREEIARQAELDREYAEEARREAERQEARRQEELRYEARIQERMRAREDADRQRKAQREADRQAEEIRMNGVHKCWNCANYGRCSSKVIGSGAGNTCGGYRPK